MTQHNGYDFGKAFEPDIAILLATTSDELGSVLRAHFCLEEFLDVWCNTITNVKDFLDIGFIGFDKKLLIAKKLGLPDELSVVLKKFNKLRNNYTHDSSSVLNIDILNDIKNAINIVDAHSSQPIPNCEDMPLEIGGKKISWDGEDTNNRERFVLLYLTFSMKLFNRFNYEFLSRKIAFNHTT
ncbi:hypothetical protein JZM32_11155 [Acinetobacter pittii]|uniref:hypothetical protein n=1 Tax=Acinetobacter pittii TaxID=48296 RepID=UPI00197FC5DD|nr:hypothetical protein [Acinetobacter pittii]MBN6528556.1 hypothetical protein [Acinetobacter pittii]